MPRARDPLTDSPATNGDSEQAPDQTEGQNVVGATAGPSTDPAPASEFDEDEEALPNVAPEPTLEPDEIHGDDAVLPGDVEPDLPPETPFTPTPDESEPEPEPIAPSDEPAGPTSSLPAGGLIGERDCPLCEGAGKIPYGVLPSPRYERCDECGGIGQVYTGSLVTVSSVVDCEKCNGAGYVPVNIGDIASPAVSLVPSPENEPPWPGAVWNAQTGAWGIAGEL